MRIKYLGHSCFLLTSDGGIKIVTDPYDGVGYDMPAVNADIVTVSHHHFDHDAVQKVGGHPKILEGEVSFEEGKLSISSLLSYHDGEHGARRGKNYIFKYLIDSIKVVHMGDIGEECTPQTAEAVGGCDVLLIPVGGTYTVDAAGAKKYVDMLHPAVVVPMHFKTPDCRLDIDGADAFLGLCADRQTVCAGNETEITLQDLSGQKIIVMSRS